LVHVNILINENLLSENIEIILVAGVILRNKRLRNFFCHACPTEFRSGRNYTNHHELEEGFFAEKVIVNKQI